MEIKHHIFLKKGKEHSLLRFHPWVFSGAIDRFETTVNSGDWVNVLDHAGKFLGAGHYQNGSIAVRILSFEKVVPDLNFWKNKITESMALRKNIGVFKKDFTNVYRLVHGEGDGLPGLIIDVYDHVAVIQAHSAGMQQDRKIIAKALHDVFQHDIQAVYFKSENDKSNDEYLFGNSSVPVTVIENGHSFQVNWIEGQKTGFFIDQRDNRQLLMKYASEKNVLNTFCYTGGFSIYALKAGAKQVDSVDASASAMKMTDENVMLNFSSTVNHHSYTEDVFDFLGRSKDQYNLIILDPPAFAKHLNAKHQAMKGYRRLNALAISNISKGGIIFTFSCSQVISRDLFYNTITAASIIAGRKVRVLHHLAQSPDHPVSIYHPEGEYLKGLVLEVE